MDFTSSYISGITANISNQTSAKSIGASVVGNAFINLANLTQSAVTTTSDSVNNLLITTYTNTKVGEQLTESGSTFSFEAPSFTGWGTQQPAYQNFDNITFKLRQYTGSFPITSLKVVIRENNFSGATLASQTVTGLTFTTGVDTNLNVVFLSAVTNSNNVPLWVGISTNGRCGRFGNTITGTTNKATFTTAGIITTEPTTVSTETPYFGEWMQFYLQGIPVNKVKSTLIQAIPDNSVVYAKTMVGDTLRTVLDQSALTLKNVSVSTLTMEQLSYAGSALDFNTSSPSTCWASSQPAAQNFDTITFGLGCGYPANPVTSLKVIIRENNASGTTLATKTVTGLVLNTDSTINTVSVKFDAVVANTNNVPLWVEILTNGRCGFYGNTITSSTSKRQFGTTTDLTTEPASTPSSDGVVKGMWMQFALGSIVPGFSDTTLGYIKSLIPTGNTGSGIECYINLPSQLYALQTQELNVYFKNIIYTNVAFSNLVVDVTCSKGKQYDNFWRYTPTTAETGTFTFTVSVYYQNTLVAIATSTVNITAIGNGNATRKINVMGDSTIASNQITIELNNLQNASGNTLKLTQIGTLGLGSTKFEGRGGYRLADYYSSGATNYVFTVSGVTTAPAIVATQYSNNGAVFLVQTNNLTAGAGTIICTLVSGTAPAASGVLTNSNAGTGDSTINFSSVAVTSSNPYYNPTSHAFDFSYYLSNNSFTMASGDWFTIQLGINDVRDFTDDASVNTAIATMITQLDAMIASYQSAVSGGKFGYVITFGPAGSQDAFGTLFSCGDQRDRVVRNFAMWKRAIIAHLDTTAKRTANIYLINSYTNLDCVNNYPTTTINLSARNTGSTITILSDALHPAVAGYQQIADGYWSLIKNIG